MRFKKTPMSEKHYRPILSSSLSQLVPDFGSPLLDETRRNWHKTNFFSADIVDVFSVVVTKRWNVRTSNSVFETKTVLDCFLFQLEPSTLVAALETWTERFFDSTYINNTSDNSDNSDNSNINNNSSFNSDSETTADNETGMVAPTPISLQRN